MLRSIQSQSRGMILLAVAAFALGACGGSSATSAPSATPTPSPTVEPSATEQPTPGGASLADAAKNFADVTSFQFTMTIEGGSLGDTLSLLPAANTDNATFDLKGAYILKPDSAMAADVTVTGSIHVISGGGFDYVDSSGSGYTQKDATNGSYADSLSPVAFFTAIDFSTGYNLQGTDTKNGVETDHYIANDSGVAALKKMGSVASVPDANWTSEVWIAKTGGWPIKLAVTATVTGGTTVVFQRLFDITQVNDPANKVTIPTNVTGA
ncbi:MAG TPA: hypothetical protein VF337_09210 [Candidatus Limnocylindrales bacterium]